MTKRIVHQYTSSSQFFIRIISSIMYSANLKDLEDKCKMKNFVMKKPSKFKRSPLEICAYAVYSTLIHESLNLFSEFFSKHVHFLQNTPTPSRDDITDNLLNIPGKKRKTASDFF